MAITLLAHGKSQGGSTNITPCYVEVIIDTRGADYLFVGCTGGAAQPIGDAFTDSKTNSWTEVPGWSSPGDGHSGNTCQSRYFWCTAPTTSATHAFRMTTANCGGLNASIVATAWIGLKQALPFTAQTWGAPLAPSLASVLGLAISPLIIGFGDGNTGSNVGAVDGAWTIIEQAPSVTGGQDPFVGLNLAYRLVPLSATVTATWTVPGAVVSGKGAGIFAFLGDDTPAPTFATTAERRLRKFPLPFDRSFYVFLRRLEVLAQSGVGVADPDAQGFDPVLQIHFSGNGGLTWGPWVTVPLGQQGDYDRRAVISQIGQLRNGYCEIVCSDPVAAYLLDCFVEADENVT